MAFTLRRDSSNVPVAAFQDTDFIDVVAWVPGKVVDEVGTTNGSGLFTCARKPLLDIDHDASRVISGVGNGGLDIDARTSPGGTQLYVGTVSALAGTMLLYTDVGRTNPYASLAAKVTYWYARGAVASAAVVNGKKTVAAAGTQEALVASAKPCSRVRLKALFANTGNVYVGDSTVDSATGFILRANEEVKLQIDDLSTVYIDVDVNGEGVTFLGS
jgi:hypothetical protein